MAMIGVMLMVTLKKTGIIPDYLVQEGRKYESLFGTRR
jgi:hypothetical protein